MAFYPKSVFDLLKSIGSETMTAKEMLRASGLDYPVKKVPIFYRGQTGLLMLPEHVATVREDTNGWLGVVSPTYGTVQNEEAFGFTEKLVQHGAAVYVKAGHDGRGARIYVVMKTPEYLSLGNGDNILCYFFLTSSHDGSMNADVFCAPYRPSTGSVITFPALRKLRFRHTKKVKERMDKAAWTLNKVKAYWEEATQTFPLMQTCKLSDDDAKFYFQTLVKDEERTDFTPQQETAIEEMFRLYKSGTGAVAPACAGTILGAYLAAVDYYDQKKTRKSKKRDEAAAELLDKLTGTAAQDKAQAYCMMLQLQRKFESISSVSQV